ncbi:MAG: hypothetical protein H7227_06565 [Actinobacteria bacterium]|nr:hypothetical protein [Actinomycetota bacterium]
MGRLRRLAVVSAVAITLLSSSSASAHQPVILQNTDTTAAKGPLLVDATISFAVRASFTKAGQTRAFRAQFNEGDQLALQYLIVDKRPENILSNAKLPRVVATSPSGVKVVLQINERTEFFEPYGRTNYFFLARYNSPAEQGVYTITITSRAKSEITIAIGEKEVAGEVVRNKSGPSK